MGDISSDAALRAHLRSELGLTDASRVSDEDIEAEIQNAKDRLSEALSHKMENGESLNFYGDDMEKCLTEFMTVRMAPLAPGKGKGKGKGKARGPPPDKIPDGHRFTVSSIRRTDFEDETLNHHRDRMVQHFNRI
jgi:hypothetical protein